MFEDLENIIEDFYNFRDIYQEQNVINKQHINKKMKFIRNSIMNNKQPLNCVFCNEIFNEVNELNEHNENFPLFCEQCNVCFVRTMFHDHICHDYIEKPKQGTS